VAGKELVPQPFRDLHSIPIAGTTIAYLHPTERTSISGRRMMWRLRKGQGVSPMKQRGWVLVAVVACLLTGVVALRAGGSAPSEPTSEVAVAAHDPLDSAAGWRYRRCQPHHWRACILKH
jgi:hypothetical protein